MRPLATQVAGGTQRLSFPRFVVLVLGLLCLVALVQGRGFEGGLGQSGFYIKTGTPHAGDCHSRDGEPDEIHPRQARGAMPKGAEESEGLTQHIER